jgi:hypothetical protein
MRHASAALPAVDSEDLDNSPQYPLHRRPGKRVQTRSKPSDFSERKNPQHSFLWRGNKAVGLHVADLRHLKDPYSDVEVAIVGKITGHFSPSVPPFAARISRVVVHVEAPGSESGNV